MMIRDEIDRLKKQNKELTIRIADLEDRDDHK